MKTQVTREGLVQQTSGHVSRADRWIGRTIAVLAAVGLIPSAAAAQAACARTITADVVALDQVVFYNRLGTYDPAGMMFALRRDVIPLQPGTEIGPGNVQLRLDKRPRPMVLRMNAGDCLQITFQNLLATTPRDNQQPATRSASVRAVGMQLVNGIASDGSNVAYNQSSVVPPGGTATYTLYGEKEGTYFMYSAGATTGGEGDGGSITRGLFGAINVEPAGSEWYRNQVTAADMDLATVKDANGYPKKTPSGHPVINYNEVYPAGHARAGRPIFKILQGNEIVHTDLDAIITGPNMGSWAPGTFRPIAASPMREKPFREFTVIFHDENGTVQAFKEFEDPLLANTLHAGRDNFAINYGSGGVGATVLANRKGLGPAANCTECKFEEFFLSSWAIGDPAMIVDVPANATEAHPAPEPLDLEPATEEPHVEDPAAEPHLEEPTHPEGTKASRVLYPDDPSGVHHSYIGDRVKIRNLHAGPAEHHVFHLHAHQWLRSPEQDNSNYMDSQGIGPGAGFTYEITWGGSGNRNKTVGDAIFHCHFYPHFAQGMWELWRNHDVFEAGTQLDEAGIPVPGSRALPDGEIAAGTPIPAIVPIPGQALAPMPVMDGSGNPGYPFFIPGKAGHRPPRPPLDVALDGEDNPIHGGLPRHVVESGTATFPELNRFDFHKDNVTMNAVELPEDGTDTEKKAMEFHATREHPTWRVDPNTFTWYEDKFITNGLLPIAGAPFADPCINDKGQATASAANPRTYKVAGFQMDVKYNKSAWHFPQHRMYALWQDVEPTMKGYKAPEPMFFRTNSGDCINFHLVNLIPKRYEMDDFQVTTPTDVIGQHIHLVKFDVTSSDGSANGWNYEDGSMSPGEVVERIQAINAVGGLKTAGGTQKTLAPQAHPFFGAGLNGEWMGAMETIQRWYADETLNGAGQDRTLRTIFTHDHMGPSTHQQAGLYAGLVTEPKGSTWRDSETGTYFGTRDDGGPTSWRADILTKDPATGQDNSFREFLLEYQDFALAYKKEAQGLGAHPQHAISPAGKFRVDDPLVMYETPFEKGQCENGEAPPCPEIVSADDPGTMTVNYRNEPLAMRVRDPNTNTQASGDAGDLSLAFSSNIYRADPDYNKQPDFYPPLTGGVQPKDPYTPLLRAYEGDKVQVRILVGAHEEGHQFSIHGVKWLAEPGVMTSGYRNSQFAGISEHFEAEFALPPLPGNYTAQFADYKYQVGSSSDDLWNGIWGIMRSYRSSQTDLLKLPNNNGYNGSYSTYANASNFSGVCPVGAPTKTFDVSLIAARTALPGGQLFYNPRTENNGPLGDSTAVIFVRSGDLDAYGKLKAGLMAEPLIIRANAGDCVNVTLRNKLPPGVFDRLGFSALPPIVNKFNMNQLTVSNKIGMHSQLLAADVTKSDGANVGFNAQQGLNQLASPGGYVTYKWYAGDLAVKNGTITATPVEFGASNLIPSDQIKQSSKGAVGALIIEPKGAYIRENLSGSKASANIVMPDGTVFKDFVLIYQDDINLRYKDGTMVPPADGTEDPEDSGHKGFNFRSEPLWRRMGHSPAMPLDQTRKLDFTNVLRNDFIPDGGDPLTPVFLASAGEKVRFRILQPGGHQRNHVFQVHGHTWQEFPYALNSYGQLVIGDNPTSQLIGSQFGIGPSSHFDIVLQNGAGGKFKTLGDYLYRDQQSFMFNGGLWGLLRVR
ncbi:MAG: copper oxidase [Gemmatimonadaceae bacterium]